MEIKKVEFVKSAGNINQCPKPYYPEIALIGRSNVGKSSLINLICNHKKLAHVSDTPGKTKTINHYLINGNWYLVDLPGYGFAKTSFSEREKFHTLIHQFIQQRKTLKCTMILIDSRLEFQKSDKDFIHWMGNQHLPFAIVLTKIDKLSKAKFNQQLKYFENQFLMMFEELPNIFCTSATQKIGREDLLAFFDYLISTHTSNIISHHE